MKRIAYIQCNFFSKIWLWFKKTIENIDENKDNQEIENHNRLSSYKEDRNNWRVACDYEEDSEEEDKTEICQFKKTKPPTHKILINIL